MFTLTPSRSLSFFFTFSVSQGIKNEGSWFSPAICRLLFHGHYSPTTFILKPDDDDDDDDDGKKNTWRA